MKPRDPSRSAELLKLLLDAPSTATELADLTGRTKRDVHVGLWVLREQGYVQTRRTVRQSEAPGRGRRRRLKLYELTARGKVVTAMQQRNR